MASYRFTLGSGSKVYGELVEQSTFSNYTDKAQGYDAATTFPTLASGATVNCVLSNPAGSGAEAIIVNEVVSSDGPVTVEFYSDSTIDSAGTLLNIENRRVGASDTSALEAQSGPTMTVNASNPVHKEVQGGGSGGKATGTAATEGGTILEPGENRHIQITSNQTDTTAAVSLDWAEYPV